MSKVIIADTETSGVGKEDQVIEFSYAELPELRIFKQEGVKIPITYSERFRPSVPIQTAALKVHGIKYTDLLKCRPSHEIEFPKDVTYMLGHNIRFDHRMLGKPDVKLICTMDLSKKLSSFLDLSFPNHKLDSLVETVSGGQEKIVEKFHSAAGDIQKNIFVLRKFLEKLPNITTWQELYQLQESLKGKK